MADVTLSRTQYDALLAAANGDAAVDVDSLQASIDAANGITRYRLLIRWYEIGGQPAPRHSLSSWPPEQEFLLEMERPITRTDVDEVLDNNATNPADPMVTTDLGGEIGLTKLDDWDFQTST